MIRWHTIYFLYIYQWNVNFTNISHTKIVALILFYFLSFSELSEYNCSHQRYRNKWKTETKIKTISHRDLSQDTQIFTSLQCIWHIKGRLTCCMEIGYFIYIFFSGRIDPSRKVFIFLVWICSGQTSRTIIDEIAKFSLSPAGNNPPKQVERWDKSSLPLHFDQHIS